MSKSHNDHGLPNSGGVQYIGSTPFDTSDPSVIGIDYTHNYSSLAAAVTAIGATEITLRVAQTETIADGVTVTIPSTMVLEVMPGGLIQGTAGGGTETLTINGGFIADPSQQCFGSNLTVTGLSYASSGWWGSVGGGVAATNAAAFQATVAAISDKGTMVIPESDSVYDFSSGFVFDVDEGVLDIRGKLEYTGTSGAAITIGKSGAYIDRATVYGLDLVKSAIDWTETCSGVRLHGIRYSEIHILRVNGFTKGIELGDGSTAGNIYFNKIIYGRISDNKIGLDFDHITGSMNGNTWIGGDFLDSDQGGANYSGSYGIYMPDKANPTSGNVFINPSSQDTGTSRDITSWIYCDAESNTFIGPRMEDDTSDARIRFGPNSTGNVLLGGFAVNQTSVYDETRNNSVQIASLLQNGRTRLHTGLSITNNYHNWYPGDKWFDPAYAAQDDSPGKICLTAGTVAPALTADCDTTAASATVTVNTGINSIWVGSVIDIAGVTGPLTVTARDVVAGTITISPVADATVASANTEWAVATFADETPLSLRGALLWNPGNVAIGGSTTTTLTVTGAEVSDMVVVGQDVDAAGTAPFAYVSAADTVTIGLNNNTGGAVDLANGYWYVRVFKY